MMSTLGPNNESDGELKQILNKRTLNKVKKKPDKLKQIKSRRLGGLGNIEKKIVI